MVCIIGSSWSCSDWGPWGADRQPERWRWDVFMVHTMVKLLRNSAVTLIHPCLWIHSCERLVAVRQILCHSVLRLSSHIRQLFPSCPPAPFVCIPATAKIKYWWTPYDPSWLCQQPLLTFLKRGTVLLCLLTAAHGGWMAHDDAVVPAVSLVV